jgi:hypothetical protein
MITTTSSSTRPRLLHCATNGLSNGTQTAAAGSPRSTEESKKERSRRGRAGMLVMNDDEEEEEDDIWRTMLRKCVRACVRAAGATCRSAHNAHILCARARACVVCYPTHAGCGWRGEGGGRGAGAGRALAEAAGDDGRAGGPATMMMTTMTMMTMMIMPVQRRRGRLRGSVLRAR